MDNKPFERLFHCRWFLATLLVSACGGGDNSAPPLTSAPGDSALSAFLRENHTYSLSGIINGQESVAQVTYAPVAGTSVFNGTANALSTVITYTLNAETPDVRTIYYLSGPFIPLGEIWGNYGVIVSYTSVPTTLNVGSSGSLDSLTYYTDATKANPVGGFTVSDDYSVKNNDSASVLFCLDRQTAEMVSYYGEDYCYTVDAAGTMKLDSIDLMPDSGNTTPTYVLKVTSSS